MAAYFPFSPAVDALIDLALTEDLCCGDLTTDSLLSGDHMARGTVVAKESLVVAGLGVFARVLERLDDDLAMETGSADGERVEAGAALARVVGPARSLLRAERTALNFLRHMSGIATLTSRYVAAVGPGGPRICDTRKTTPGHRELEKYAVRMGGGFNHRFNLGAAAMIKDNHIAAVGSIGEAVRRLRGRIPHTATIEVEVTNLHELDQALLAGADSVLLDNMSDDDMREAVRRCRGRVVTEASGRVTLERLEAIGGIGVDIISCGALTHSAPAADISLDLDLEP